MGRLAKYIVIIIIIVNNNNMLCAIYNA